MFFKEELWLILVGLIVSLVVRKLNGSSVAWKKIALYACALSVLVGELGMLTQLFFPSDLLGLMLTCLAALIGAKIAIGERTAANRSHAARGGGAARNK